jgi:hypothetical protein
MREQLAASPMGRPLVVESAELPEGMRGEVLAVVAHPLQQVVQALAKPSNWCPILLLHIDNRRCDLSKGEEGAATLALGVVRRYDHPPESAFMLSLQMQVDESTPDYLRVDLRSDNGPMGTRSHRVLVEAVALPDAAGTFLHLRYSYEHNTLARIASQAYLATFGWHKVGFSTVGTEPSGGPEYIRGLRGLVERNAVRYFLAVDAYLDAMRAPPTRQATRRMEAWYDSAERYSLQLHETDKATYMALKRGDLARAEAAGKP